MKFYISKKNLDYLSDFDTFLFYKNRQANDDICFVKESDLKREIALNESISEYMDMCESLSLHLNSKVKTATIEELKQNPHVHGLLETLKFYGNEDNYDGDGQLCEYHYREGEKDWYDYNTDNGFKARTKLKEWSQ